MLWKQHEEGDETGPLTLNAFTDSEREREWPLSLMPRSTFETKEEQQRAFSRCFDPH